MNILIVDDHPMVLIFYENMLLRDLRSMEPLHIVTATNCEEACNAIAWATESGRSFDLAILDHSLPSYPEKGIFTGSDIAGLLREAPLPCQIIIITSHTETLMVYEMLQKVKPEGLAIKNDINEETFSEMVRGVIGGNLYRSPLVKACVSQIWKREMLAEENNRQILFHLSKGYKINEMEKVINLTSRTIERRIAEIRKTFKVADNQSLLKVAIEEGFL